MIVKNVAYVIAHGGPARVTVIGRTDRVGSAPENLALSARRAMRSAMRSSPLECRPLIVDTSWIGEGVQTAAAADEAVNPRSRAVDVTVHQQSR